jgi:hypothetical protein
MGLNIYLRIDYISTHENLADFGSREIDVSDSMLSKNAWEKIQYFYGGHSGHTFDLIALDSNANTDKKGRKLPHFSLFPQPESAGIDFLTLKLHLGNLFIFPPYCEIPVITKHMSRYADGQCTLAVPMLLVTPTWWSKVCKQAESWLKLGKKGDIGPLLTPSKKGS